jgi:uncharacterized protein with beta-barrel porin domain
LKAAPNVFLDAALAYDPNNVFLNINRIDVSKAVAGLGLDSVSLASAARMETAMQAIDGQVGGIAPGGIGGSFIQGAGAFQQAGSAAEAARSLRSLSGELHGVTTTITLEAIDTGRRSLAQRVDQVTAAPARAGGWYRDVSSGGQSALGGLGQASNGQRIGNDWRLGTHALLGVGMSTQEQASWLGHSGDQGRGHQQEVQLYAAHWQGPWQAQAQWASGNYQRQLQRNLVLGELQETVGSQRSGHYQSAYAELGRQFHWGDMRLTPYVGSQFLRVADAGFDEGGSTGFGLRANAWDASRWQGMAGLRASQQWRLGDAVLRADAYAEWQHTFAAQGFDFSASYRGVSQWAALPGLPVAAQAQSFGLGVTAAWSNQTALRFDLSRRSSGLGSSNQATLWGSYRY